MEVIVEEYKDDINRTVYLDKDDICLWCEQQYGCPLIECLSNGLVIAEEPIRVLECEHYRMFDGK